MSRNILAERNVDVLRAIAARGALLAFDYDGTLAPMGNDPDGSRMRPESLELLRSLAHVAPVAVITGRAVHDVTQQLESIPMLAVIGNHGAEPSPFARKAVRQVTAWLPELEAVVATLPGVVIENKAMSVSVHYWHSSDPRRVIEAIETLVPTLPHRVDIVHGIGLINLVPRGAPNKGDALMAIVKRHELPAALFVGDELTDESGFRSLIGTEGLGLRVGRWNGSAATYHIGTQLDIDAVLAELLVGATRAIALARRIARDAASPVASDASA